MKCWRACGSEKEKHIVSCKLLPPSLNSVVPFHKLSYFTSKNKHSRRSLADFPSWWHRIMISKTRRTHLSSHCSLLPPCLSEIKLDALRTQRRVKCLYNIDCERFLITSLAKKGDKKKGYNIGR